MLFLTARHGKEKREWELHKEFAEGMLDTFTRKDIGYPMTQFKSRYRDLKFLVHAGDDAVEGIMKFAGIPMNGKGATVAKRCLWLRLF